MMKTSAAALLVAVSFERSRGGGHLLRGAALVRGLRALGREAYLLLCAGRGLDEARALAGTDLDSLVITETNAAARRWQFVITDRFRIPRAEFSWLRSLGPVLAIDEGGCRRSQCDFLLDLLPPLPSCTEANFRTPALLPLPRTRKPALFPPIPASGAKALVVFGAEDAARLAPEAARAALGFCGAAVTVVSRQAVPDAPRLTAVPAISNLKEEFARFDLVITHFGLAAFEALHAGTPVMLIAPTRYHRRLGRAACFFQAEGTGRKAVRRLARLAGKPGTPELIRRASGAAARRYGLLEAPLEDLASFTGRLAPSAPAVCPLCGAKPGPVIARFAARSYRRCGRCKTYLLSRATPPEISYTDSYFFEDYQRQYGKTYLEDFPHLTALAKARLRHIKSGGKLLDIGCAYGPFLAAASEAGFEARGIDPSEGAVRFVREKLGLNAAHGCFPDAAPEEPESFDVITLWYVIEHFTAPARALNTAARLLKPGGILAFSTPSAGGISAFCSRRRFLEASPADHWTIWRPRAVRAILKQYGFTVSKTVITGHHPERFPLIGKHLRRRAPLYHVFMLISKIFRLGDTFEVYARKTRPLSKL